jgi:hypothetical protein
MISFNDTYAWSVPINFTGGCGRFARIAWDPSITRLLIRDGLVGTDTDQFAWRRPGNVAGDFVGDLFAFRVDTSLEKQRLSLALSPRESVLLVFPALLHPCLGDDPRPSGQMY